jgi:uncharacterized protein (DUF1697 family)
MNPYLVLLRGINVGGKNIVAMASLKRCLEDLGFAEVSTYIASGNVLLASDESAAEIRSRIEAALTRSFNLDSELIKVLVLSRSQLRAVIDRKPKGFGEQPEKYHSDAIFLMDIDATQAMAVFSPREGVDSGVAGRRHHLLATSQCRAHQEPTQQGHGLTALQIHDHPELGHDNSGVGHA